MNYESRDQIEEKYRWDLSSMFESDEAFEQALVDIKTYPEQLAAYRGKISQSASELLAYLRLEDHVALEFEKAWNYAERRSDEDTRVSKYQAYTSRCMSLYTQLEEAGSWFNA